MKPQYYRSPIGPLEITCDERGLAALRVLSAKKRVEPLRRFHSLLSKKCSMQLSQYFLGRRKSFNLPVSLNGTAFQKRVWSEIIKIPFGGTVSYKEIARRAGKPQAIRAAASAVGDNPIPIIVPCHRVIRHDGSLGGYALGIKKKGWLLRHEQTTRP